MKVVVASRGAVVLFESTALVVPFVLVILVVLAGTDGEMCVLQGSV